MLLQETHSKYKKKEKWKRASYDNANQKKTRLVILQKRRFESKEQDKKGHFIMVKESITKAWQSNVYACIGLENTWSKNG